MSGKALAMICGMVMPVLAFAGAKTKGTIDVKVVSSQMKIHGVAPRVFTYTDVIFAQVDGQEVVFSCEQKGDVCPPMVAGKTYSANQDGDVIYFSLASPDEDQTFSVKYKRVGPKPRRAARAIDAANKKDSLEMTAAR